MAKIERTKNATRNIIFGTILRINTTLVPFLMRTAMIHFMGVQYLGLSSLFTSVLQVLNLAELGVGSAMVFSMYKPISVDDNSTICALMRLYKLYYRVIGLIIAVIGITLTPFIPHLIKGDVPAEINIYILYLLNLAATVFSYWLFAYKNSILTAHQRNDVVSIVTLLTRTVQYGIQFLVLWLLKDYYVYVIVALFTQIMTNIATAVAANKLYPNYKAQGKLPREAVQEINRRIKDLFTSKIGSIVVNSADTIVISAFLGLKMLAIYQNYYFILTSIIGFVTIVFSSCTAGIGNSLITETREKNFNDLKKFTFIISWIAGFCSCCFLNLFQPFMKIWVGEDLMLQYTAVICFVVYFFIYEINQLLNLYKDAGGIWHKDRFRPMVTALANLGMNLIMVQFWGIYGVLLSTVLSMLFVGIPWLFNNLFSTMFEKTQLSEYLKNLAAYVIIDTLTCALTVFTCHFIDIGKWGTLILRLIVCLIVPNVIFLLVYKKTEEFTDTILLLNNMTRGKIKKVLKVAK